MPPIAAAEAILKQRARLKMVRFFTDSGPSAREFYPKQMEFFQRGSTHPERLFMAANRVGKSEAGSYELTMHLTGKYPNWWPGRRFNGPIEAWACGTTSETTRDIVQEKLLGKIDSVGTGMIPGDLIRDPKPRRSGLAGSLESCMVQHVSGGWSQLNLKTYEQGRQSFEGTAKHVIWCDEEPPLDCYTEMLLRTATTKGIVITTFTPLQGMSDVVKSFLEPEREESSDYKTVIQAGWDDVPHLDPDEKRRLIATMPPYQIAARTKGEPSLGVGAIYPIAEEEITVPTAPIPDYWLRAYALDVGWNRTAVIWGARNPANNVVTLYDEYYQGHGEPATHALAIRQRGAWIPGVIDPASAGASQIDGRSAMALYNQKECGLHLLPADNTVETGISVVWQAMVSGQLKVQAHLLSWFREFRKYHRDDKGQGKIVKRDDHLMDATRYLMVSGMPLAILQPKPKQMQREQFVGAYS